LQLAKNTDLALSKKIAQESVYSNLLNKYIDNVKSMSSSTATQYKCALNNFANFVYMTYGFNIDILVDKILYSSNHNKTATFDPYDVLSKYTAFLVGNIAPTTIKHRLLTIKNFFEYCDIEISPRKFRLKVRLPKSIRKEKEPLTKEDIVSILNSCSTIRLKTYIMLLAATGMRASEAISIRLCDLDLESIPSKLFIRGEYTKTKSDRTVLLTQEMKRQLMHWLDYKYRTRRVSFYDKNTRKSISEYRTPSKIDNDLIFSTKASSGGYLSVCNQSLYIEFAHVFGKTLERLGRGQREESPGAQHRKITLHSMRRWVKSTISDLGYYDYSEWFIGHSGSTYYRKSEKEKAEIFRKIEPYLTFLDYEELERKGADIASQLEEKDRMIQNMMRKQEQFEHLIQSLIDSGQLRP